VPVQVPTRARAQALVQVPVHQQWQVPARVRAQVLAQVRAQRLQQRQILGLWSRKVPVQVQE
jgi:hypothetical protein